MLHGTSLSSRLLELPELLLDISTDNMAVGIDFDVDLLVDDMVRKRNCCLGRLTLSDANDFGTLKAGDVFSNHLTDVLNNPAPFRKAIVSMGSHN